MKRLVDQKELIQMIYNGSNKKSFYLADKHWLDGKEIKIEHAHPEQMDLIQHHKIKKIDIKVI